MIALLDGIALNLVTLAYQTYVEHNIG